MREHPRSDARPGLPFGTAFGCLHLAALAAAALAAGAAHADTPIQPYYQIQLGAFGDGTSNQAVSNQSFTAPLSGALGFPNGYASAFTRTDNGGLAQVNFQLHGAGNNQVSALAHFEYLLTLVPLTPDAPSDVKVPVHIVTHGAANVTLSDGNGYVNAGAYFKVWQDSSLVDLFAGDTDGSDSAGAGFAFDQEVMASTASELHVSLMATTGVSSWGWGVSIGSAYVDPIFTIDDPHWASLYKIVGVPGDAAPPSNAVPEPAAWTMMLAGFGLVGCTLRSRGRTRVSFA